MTVSKERGKDRNAKKDNNETPISRVGRLIGMVRIALKRFLKGKLYLINPKAAGVPIKADTDAVPKAMIKLFFKAGHKILFSSALEYHFNVNPSNGKTPVVLLLKERTTSIMAGRNKKSNASIEYVSSAGRW